MVDVKKCPQCDAELPADAPESLCPKCLLINNLSLDSSDCSAVQEEPTAAYHGPRTAPAPS